MADKPASERTEQATPERLRKAREEGKVPQSSEVPSALMVGALLIALALAGPIICQRLAWVLRQGMAFELPDGADGAALPAVLARRAADTLAMVVPFLLAGFAVSVFGGLLVGGWTFAPGSVSPNFERILPTTGLKNLFGLRSLVHLLASIAKLAVILVIVWLYLRSRLTACTSLKYATAGQCLVAIAQLVFGLLARVAMALLAIGIGDAFFQRWKYRRDLKMTRQEVKEELRQHELSPQIRSRIRSVQLSLARRRMLKEVPSADVVVVNPTHVAVALKYEAEAMDAPEVVAKGADLVAEKIRQVAEAHGVPIVRRPELARTLYETVEIGQTVPQAMFVAVAEVLAMIYRLRKKRRGATGGREQGR